MPTRTSLDLFKRYRSEYVAPRQPRLFHIGPADYLTIAGAIAANPPDTDALEQALYIVVSALRPITIAAHQRDFIFGKLEWLLSGDEHTSIHLRKVMMRVPDFITNDDVSRTLASLLARGLNGTTAVWVRQAQLERIAEGLCAQMLQAGPTDCHAQTTALSVLRQFATAQGLESAGPLHAVYLTSARHVAPEHRRMLLRLPVRPASISECALVASQCQPAFYTPTSS